MATIAAIKAVLLDKEKRANAHLNKNEAKSNVKSTTSTLKPSKLPVSASASTSSKKSSSSAQSLADAITNARKAESSKSKVPCKSPAKKMVKSENVESSSSKIVGGGFTELQVKRMTKEFSKKDMLSKEETKAISLEIGLKEEQVKRWFANRRNRNARTGIHKQEEKSEKSHGLRNVEVSVLMPMADILSLSRIESGPEVVDILDDSLESDDDEVSLIEVSNVSTAKINPGILSGSQKPSKTVSSSISIPTTISSEKVAKVVTAQSNTIKVKTAADTKPAPKPSRVSKQSVREPKKEKEVVKEKIVKTDSKPCTKEEDLVEELLRRIEELEEDLKDREGDLYYTKKDLESVQATLEGKERVLNTVQESIPKVVSEHKKALQNKDDKISELKLSSDKLQRELEAKPVNLEAMDQKNTIQVKDDELTELRTSNNKLKKELEAKLDSTTNNEEIEKLRENNAILEKEKNSIKSELSNIGKIGGDGKEVNRLKECNLKLEKVKMDLESELLKFKSTENVDAELKESNVKLKKEVESKVEYEKGLLKKHEDECLQLRGVIEKSEERIALLDNDLGKKEDEIQILKYKERRAIDNHKSVEETKRLLEENRKDTLALKDYERKLTRKITSLELDLFTKTAESQTQALIVTRLNEKIQSLQQKSVDSSKKDEQLDVCLAVITKDDTEVTEDPTSDDDSIINGLPQTSPYVVNSSRKKRKRQEDSHSDSDDDLPCTPDALEEPEFESLCAEIETLCVPHQRPLPVFPTPNDSKKVRFVMMITT